MSQAHEHSSTSETLTDNCSYSHWETRSKFIAEVPMHSDASDYIGLRLMQALHINLLIN